MIFPDWFQKRLAQAFQENSTLLTQKFMEEWVTALLEISFGLQYNKYKGTKEY